MIDLWVARRILKHLITDFRKAVDLCYWEANKAAMNFNKSTAKDYDGYARNIDKYLRMASRELRDIEKSPEGKIDKLTFFSKYQKFLEGYQYIPVFVFERL